MFCCFAVKEPDYFCLLLLAWSMGWGIRARWWGSKRALHLWMADGWWWSRRLGAWCWLCWSGQRAFSWGLPEPGLGRLQVHWGLQDCGPAWESGLPVKEALLPVTRVSLGETRVQGMASTGYLALTRRCYKKWNPGGVRSGLGGHERAAGGAGGHALVYGRVDTLVVTPRRPRRAITGGRDGGAGPRSPFVEEAAPRPTWWGPILLFL